MTCKDCIHYDVCYHVEHYGRELETDKPCEQFKSADVIEVVRCSECKYFGKELKQGKHSCLNYQLPYCLENDYCSYGERKDGEQNGL